MIALNPIETVHYIPACDRNLSESLQTIFVIKPLTPKEHAVVDNEFGYVQDGRFHLLSGEQDLLLLHLGLVDVKNFTDNQGKQVPFKRTGIKTLGRGAFDEIDQDFLARIPANVRGEVAKKIREISTVENELGN